MSASIGVVMNKNTKLQRFFGCGESTETKDCHNDDITAISVHPDRVTIATGQVGKNPLICLWNSETMKLIRSFKLGRDKRAVRTLAFSPSGKYLAASGDDNEHVVVVFDVESGEKICEENGGPDPIIDIDFNTKNEHVFATAGKNGVKYYDFENPKQLDSKKGIFGKHKMTDMTGLQFLSNGNLASGSLKGDIYIWNNERQCVKQIEGHKGYISALGCINSEEGD